LCSQEPRGLSTVRSFHTVCVFDMEFELRQPDSFFGPRYAKSDGVRRRCRWRPNCAEFLRRDASALDRIGIRIEIASIGTPNEGRPRLSRSKEGLSATTEYGPRCRRARSGSNWGAGDRVMKTSRGVVGKASTVQFFWGAMAWCTRFCRADPHAPASGRPPNAGWGGGFWGGGLG